VAAVVAVVAAAVAATKHRASVPRHSAGGLPETLCGHSGSP
jgi:hypothetical protein